jgi:hypothetical protein
MRNQRDYLEDLKAEVVTVRQFIAEGKDFFLQDQRSRMP